MRLATRRSALALAQAELVARELGGCELVPITTGGDRGAPAQDKSRWVDELERALLEGRADVAVHSAKDLPGELAEGLEIAGAPGRAAPEDVLCGAAGLDELAPGARVGTSSIRRIAQLRAAREDLEVTELRGNVDTRLARLADPARDLQAIVLARAGLARLGREQSAGASLDPKRFVPAPGQGTLALEVRAGDEDAGRAARADQRRGDVREPAGRAGAGPRAGRRLPHAAGGLGELGRRRAAAPACLGRPARRLGLGDRRAVRRERRSRGAGRDDGGTAAQRRGPRAAAAGGRDGGRVSGQRAAGGRVYLVGAGPGDPGLMSARALELISIADVILHDRLIPEGALDGARPDAELVFVGKEGGGSSADQRADRGAAGRARARGQEGRAPEGGRPVRVRARGRGGAHPARRGRPVRGRTRV